MTALSGGHFAFLDYVKGSMDCNLIKHVKKKRKHKQNGKNNLQHLFEIYVLLSSSVCCVPLRPVLDRHLKEPVEVVFGKCDFLLRVLPT